MRRVILVVGGLATAGLFVGCAPAYVEPRPAYGRPYGAGYGREYREERRERHEAREHERSEWRAPEDGD